MLNECIRNKIGAYEFCFTEMKKHYKNNNI